MRNSQEFSEQMSYDTRTLPSMDNLREGSLEDISDLASRNYPYLSNSTYSLPRNHKLYKTNSTRRYAPSFRESQESLLRNSSDVFYPESRETLLNRYPGSGRNTPGQSPHTSRPSSPQTPGGQRRATPSYGLQPSYSGSAFPAEYQNYHHQPQPHQPQYQPQHHQQPGLMEGRRRGYQGEERHWAGYHSDYDYRRSVPVSPSSSLRSSRAASPSAPRPASSYSRRSSPSSRSRRSSPGLASQDYRRPPVNSRLHEVTSHSSHCTTTTSTTGSARSSRTSSARSSRASSPRPGPGPGPDSQTLERMLVAARQQTQTGSDQKSKIVYVRETFQVIPADDFHQDQLQIPLLRSSSSHSVKVFDEDKILDMEDTERDRSVVPSKSCMSDKGVMTDGEEDDKVSVASSKKDKGTHVDLSSAGITNIEEMLESLSRRVRSVETAEIVDNDDSARAESVASLVSSTSSRGAAGPRKPRLDSSPAAESEAHSMIRRQSVIIEGLTLETDELKRRCQMLEDDMETSVVEEVQTKLVKMESKLEETENYCYQVVEENVELKSEIETLESEISEVQDTFRDKDAKEFKKTKWELENLSKTCRNLQLKLGKAQARASRLRQEKEEIEEQQREQKLWKTTAVMAAAALAVMHLVNKYK